MCLLKCVVKEQDVKYIVMWDEIGGLEGGNGSLFKQIIIEAEENHVRSQ